MCAGQGVGPSAKRRSSRYLNGRRWLQQGNLRLADVQALTGLAAGRRQDRSASSPQASLACPPADLHDEAGVPRRHEGVGKGLAVHGPDEGVKLGGAHGDKHGAVGALRRAALRMLRRHDGDQAGAQPTAGLH